MVILLDSAVALYVGLQHAVHLLKSARVHFVPGSDGRSFRLEYSWKFHLNCMVAAPGMLLIVEKKLKEACAAHAVPA